MAVDRRATSTVVTSVNGGTSVAVTYPSNLVGDVAILTVTATVSVNTPSGWTLIASNETVTSARLFVFWRYISTVQSGSQTVTHAAGISRAAITTYSGARHTAPTSSEYVIYAAPSASTAVTTNTAITFNRHGILIVAAPPAPTISAQAASGTGWTISEAYDSISGGVPSISLTDGSMSTGGSATMTGTLSSSAQYTAFGLALQPAASAVTFDAASTSITSATNVVTQTHVVGSGSNRILLVATATRYLGVATVSGITYNGVALTKIDGIDGTTDTDIRSELWYLLNPPTGSYSLVTTFTVEPTRVMVTGISYSGVAQTTPIAASGSATGSSTSALASVTSTTDGSLLVAAVMSRTVTAMTPTAGETERSDLSAGTSHRGGTFEQVAPLAGTYSVGPTVGSGSWVNLVAAINPYVASGGGGTTGQIKTPTVAKPLKSNIGGTWTTKPVKRWNGSAWVVTNY